MNKRYLHHIWKRIRAISTWYLVTILVVFSVFAVISLRQNNLNALKLRDAVLQADKDNGDVETALRNLREYVYAHMNTNLSSGPNAIKPPIQLKYRYDRLVQAEKDRVSSTNDKIYSDAQAYCEAKIPNGLSGGGRVPCIQDYVTTHGTTAQTIPDTYYKFDFVSPGWTPDKAGLSIVIATAAALLLVVRFILERWLKLELS